MWEIILITVFTLHLVLLSQKWPIFTYTFKKLFRSSGYLGRHGDDLMKIAFESTMMLPYFSEALSSLMGGARICLDNIHYDEVNGIVSTDTKA